MRMIDDIAIWGDPIDEGALAQIKTCRVTGNAVRCAMMADHHKGYAVPIGGVVAYQDAISPSGVGFDIACGNKAVRLDVPGIEIQAKIKTIMDDVWKNISFGVGRQNQEEVDDPLFDDPTWSIKTVAPLKEMARKQLGTVGSGNHFVDVFLDEEYRPWIGVHFGSRGLGHKIATAVLKAAGASDGMDVPPCVIPVNSELGLDYVRMMHLAGQYAHAGRDWVCQKVASMIGAPIVEEVHNHHNYAWLEEHANTELWVVRKGATPAHIGQKSFIGSTMSEPSLIVEGICPKTYTEQYQRELSISSTIHGAGRTMGRREAKGVTKKGVVIREGKVSPEMMQERVKAAGVELRGAGVDESPHCYKRLDQVVKEHLSSIKILHLLKPIGVAMAGPDTFDPYKD